jgi:hypothetical protein
MSLSLDDLKAEINEYHNRIEEVLNGMDAVIVQQGKRISTLEGQLAALGDLAAALSDEAEIIIPPGTFDPRVKSGGIR